ncbi:MAG: hypothetical protein JW873_01240 [Candidatus Saganbacteria bacterium]|nr:hypothetical protein [Candidatus Saganbacteria bacterium]
MGTKPVQTEPPKIALASTGKPGPKPSAAAPIFVDPKYDPKYYEDQPTISDEGKTAAADGVAKGPVPVKVPVIDVEIAEYLDQASGKHHFNDKDVKKHPQSYETALHELLNSGPVTREKLAAFLKEYYDVDKVTEEFWAAFSGDGQIRNAKELQDCLENFLDNMALTRAPLKYMCENDEVYIIPSGGRPIKDLRQQGITSILEYAAKNPKVKEAWLRAKQMTGYSGRDDKDAAKDDKTWEKFEKYLAMQYWKPLAEKFALNDLHNGNRLVRELSDQYLRRWMTTGEGLDKKEWKGLLEKQTLLERMGKDYGPEVLAKVTLPPFPEVNFDKQTSTEVLAKALELYKADPQGNKEQVVGLLGTLTDANFSAKAATPVIAAQAADQPPPKK